MNYLARWLTYYLPIQARLCRWLLLLLGILMTVLILLQVFFRFVIYLPLPWSEECARYLMVWMGMLGSVLALEKGRHIGVTFFIEYLPAAAGRRLASAVQLLMAGFLGVMFYQGTLLSVLNINQQSPALEISMLIPYLALPVGFAMMILILLGDFARQLAGKTDDGATR